MGETGEPLAALCRNAEVPALRDCPAVTLADQEKAFERMGHGWLRLVLRGWGAPEWSVNVAAALVTGRTVVARVGGRRGP
eukprot:2538294-Lingulodinium_polyedra.AAC.1